MSIVKLQREFLDLLAIPSQYKVSDPGKRDIINHLHKFIGFSSARRVSPPTKSRPLPPLEAVEDATWRKGLSPRKSSVAQSGIAPRMIAASVSANRKKAIRSSTKGFHLTPDDVGPPIFVGRDMKLYVDDDDQLACESDIEEIPADTTRQRK